jgi:ADP-ribose pyrophosphatase YjhB (NUDIX family)
LVVLYTEAAAKIKDALRVSPHQTQRSFLAHGIKGMKRKREYPEHPMVGVGGVVIRDGRALLIRRGSEPLKGEWSIPGGMLEVGETLAEGVVRELWEETGLRVRVLELVEIFERIFHLEDQTAPETKDQAVRRPLYHFVIIDYLCEIVEGDARAGSDVTDLVFATEDELARYQLTPTATRVVKKAFELSRAKMQKSAL